MAEQESSSDSGVASAAIRTWGTAVDRALSIAAESPDMRATGLSLARSARTVADTIHVCLMPLAIVNFAYAKGRDYFENNFRFRLEERTKDIPLEAVQDPSPAVAAQALQGLAFAHEEPSLEDMYLQLLATSMDGRKPKDSAHPAFVEVIRQLTSVEASLLQAVYLRYDTLPIAQLRKRIAVGGTVTVVRFLTDIRTSDGPAEIEGLGLMLDNWVRLGLIEIGWDRVLNKPDSYLWVEERPETIRTRASNDNSTGEISIKQGVLVATEFGQRFAQAVGLRKTLPSES